MVKKRLNNKSLAEAYEIIMLLDEENIQKIPKELLNMLEEKRDKEYIVDIEKVLNGEMLLETKDILCAIYYKYLSTDEEKEVIEGYKNSIKKNVEENENRANTNISFNIFKENIDEKIEIKEEAEKELPTVAEKKNILWILLDKIKNIFKKNKEV